MMDGKYPRRHHWRTMDTESRTSDEVIEVEAERLPLEGEAAQGAPTMGKQLVHVLSPVIAGLKERFENAFAEVQEALGEEWTEEQRRPVMMRCRRQASRPISVLLSTPSRPRRWSLVRRSSRLGVRIIVFSIGRLPRIGLTFPDP